MVEVVNIAPEHEHILLFLYPEYSYQGNQLYSVSKVIGHKNILRKVDRDMVDYDFTDSVLISKQIFDQYLDEQALIDRALRFAKERFGCRKRKLDIPKGDNFAESLISFMYTGEVQQIAESHITSLFDSFGSKRFLNEFLTLSCTNSVEMLAASMFTFINRIISVKTSPTSSPTSSPTYYRQKALLFNDKIRRNFEQAYSRFRERPKDIYGLSYAKLFTDLTESK